MSNNNELLFPMGISGEEARGIELPTGKLAMSDAEAVAYFTEIFRIDNEARKNIETVWDRCWNLYLGRYDFSSKEDWQSKLNIPKVRGVVDKATATMKRALVRMKRFYHIESETREGVEAGFFTMKLIDYYLDQLSFAKVFSEALKVGLITSTIAFKVWWNWTEDREPRWETFEETEPVMELGLKIGERIVPVQKLVRTPRVKGMLGIAPVDPYRLWVGPNQSRFIEKATVSLSYLEELAGKGIYSKEAVDKLRARSEDKEEAYKEAVRKGQTPPKTNQFIREVDIYHYWGPLYGSDGKLLAKSATFTVGDKDVVLRKPEEVPFFHGASPYVVGTPYIVPFSTYNRGIVEDIVGIASMITELANLIIDGAQFDALAAYEGDLDLMSHPEKLKNGMHPGIFVETNGFENPHGKNVVRQIATGKVPTLALQVMRLLDTEQQLATSVTNAQRGASIAGVDTATEFQSIVGSANETLDDAARTVEETTMDQLLERVAKTIYQYHEDYTLARLQEEHQQVAFQLQGMTSEERYATMMGGFNFKARGLSIFLDKQQDLQKTMRLVELLANIPGLLTRLNLDEVLEQIVVSLGWNPRQMLINPANPGVTPANPLPQQPMLPAPGAGEQTPAQVAAGIAGAQQGGSRNNPQAGFGFNG